MIEKLEKITESFPEAELPFKTLKFLKILGLKIKPSKYVGFSMTVAALCGIAFLLAIFIAGNMGLAPECLLVFASVFGFFIYLPAMEYKKFEQEAETEMPFFLRTLATLIEIGVPFENALEIASSGKSAWSRVMKNTISQLKMGITLHNAISSLSLSFSSLQIKRALVQLLFVYESGGSGSQIKRLSEDLLSAQQHALRSYAAKSSMFGLIFIMSSSIMPVFFLIFITAGKAALGTNINNLEIAIAFLVFFPALSLLIIWISKSIMPPSPFSSEKSFDPSIALPLAIMVAGTVVFQESELLFVIIGLVASVAIIYRTYQEEKRVEEIEGSLADAVFAISGMPKSAKLEKIFEIIENGSYGALSKEGEKTKKQLKMNVSYETALDDLAQRNHSGMLKRMCTMMKHMVRTNSVDRMNALAEDIVRSTQIRNERQSLLAMQKYTIIFGSVLVPLILKVALTLLKSMSGLIGPDGGSAEGIDFSFRIIPAYMIMYAAVSSYSISESSSKKSDQFLYFILISVVGLIVFNLVSF